MPTYKQIQEHVKAHHGFNPKTCWIAHVKSEMGFPVSQAQNRQTSGSRIHPCPPNKLEYIKDAILTLGALDT